MSTTMKNTHIIFLNNSAVDALYAGDIRQGFKILSQTFFHSAQHRHETHNLRPKSGSSDGGSTGLEFSLQDCSQSLEKVINQQITDDVSCHSFLCLNFLRIEYPVTDPSAKQVVDELCNCSVTWALGYNLSVIYAILAFRKGHRNGGKLYFQKSLRMLAPIKRRVMLLRPQQHSPFWTNLKLSVLNNYTCINGEIQNRAEVASTVRVMGGLLVQCPRDHLDPIDVKKYYLSIQFLNMMCTTLSFAAAA